MSRPLVSLGDLLQALQVTPEFDRPALARVLGLDYAAAPEPSAALPTTAQRAQAPALPEPRGEPALTEKESSAPSPHFWRVAGFLQWPQSRPDLPAWLADQALGDPQFYLPPPDARPPATPPLLSRGRFARFMRERLTVQRRSGHPDLRKITALLAQRRHLHRLPQQQMQSWPAQVRVVVDGALALQPFHHDVRVLLAQMKRQLGARLQVLQADGEPLVSSGGPEVPLPADATPTLVFSDAGTLHRDAATQRRWALAAQRLQRAGRTPVLLTPMAPTAARSAALMATGSGWLVRQFDGRGGLRRPAQPAVAEASAAVAEAAMPGADALGDSARHLRATLWGHSYVTPGLLRALRQLLQRHGLGGGVADELAVWHDEAVASNANACTIRRAHREVVRIEFLQLPPEVQAQVVALHLDHLAHESPMVRAEYVQHLSGVFVSDASADTHAPAAQGAAQVAKRLAQAREASDAVVAQAAAWLLRDQGAVQQDLAAYMARLGSRSAELLAGSEILRTAWALAHQQALQAGAVDLPPGLDLEQLAWVFDDRETPLTHRLRLQGSPVEAGVSRCSLVFEAAPVPPQPAPTGCELLHPVPAAPYVTLETDAYKDWMRMLVTVLGWLQAWRQEGRFKAFTLRLDRAWARPVLNHLLTLTGDPEQVALEWMAFVRAGDFARYLNEHSVSAEVFPGALVSLLWDCLGDDLGSDLALRMPRLPEEKQHLRQGGAALLSTTWLTTATVGPLRLTIDPFQRPAWADEIKVEGSVVQARTPEGRWLVWMPACAWTVVQSSGPDETYTPPAGFWWDAEEADAVLTGPSLRLRCPPWAARHGVDEHGYWAELELPPPASQRAGLSPLELMFDAQVRQRFRFIPPGRFWMGSPQAEQGRQATEALHPVTLTRGFWLADTACTQALWQAVLDDPARDRPESFGDLPAANLSMDDIADRFLPALQRLAPQMPARLPLSAEWEMAARAGTLTAYPWGEEPDRERLVCWHDDDVRPQQAPSVRRVDPNAWGLFQMHGGVWEWCMGADVERDAGSSLDPQFQAPFQSILRGGSWMVDPRQCRSASGAMLSNFNNDHDFGFRVAAGLQVAVAGEAADARRLDRARSSGPRAPARLPRARMAPLPPVFPQGWAVAYGEDRFGLWQAFEIKGVRQVLRWVPPGEFEMGSPEDEPGRSDDETLHLVRLTQGLWLADTACTQALWAAVMDGDAPSRFAGADQNPVECVGWNQVVTGFLPRAITLLHGASLRLPTEAEWEYACRADDPRRSPFCFGDHIDGSQVNFNGAEPMPGDKPSIYRGRTVPVNSLLRNAWGLYQMHGNVNEWCADLDGPISGRGAALVDPTGPLDDLSSDSKRVLRGGSWVDPAQNCRSAQRWVSTASAGNSFTGFRLACSAS